MGRGLMRHGAACLLVSALLAAGAPASAAERPTAVFDVELLDTSGEGTNPAQQKRIALASEELRRLVDASPDYAAVPLAPLGDALAERLPIRSCNGCELDLAKAAGAEVAFSAVIHKISTLILGVQIVGRDLDGKVVAFGTADIRGDTDAAWLHGIRYLARNKLGLGDN